MAQIHWRVFVLETTTETGRFTFYDPGGGHRHKDALGRLEVALPLCTLVVQMHVGKFGF